MYITKKSYFPTKTTLHENVCVYIYVSIGVYMIEESFMENKKTETSVSASIFDCETIETVEKVFSVFLFYFHKRIIITCQANAS